MRGIEDIEGLERTDAIEDLRVPAELQYPDECIENAKPISLNELKNINPDIAACIYRINERLGNDYPDGFIKSATKMAIHIFQRAVILNIKIPLL